MDEIILKIRQELMENIDSNIISSGQNFFKEEIKLYGVKTAVVGKIAKQSFSQIKYFPKIKIFELCEVLWQSAYMEESFIACNWSYFINKQYHAQDFIIFENWVDKYVANWASCDTLCNHTIGTFLEMYPEYLANLKEWAKSKNRWMRRASAVSLIIPARAGKFLEDVFEIADILLLDTDDLVKKGYGWMLKAASQSHQAEVFQYVMHRKKKMPRTALRYAIEKMPKELKTEAMAK